MATATLRRPPPLNVPLSLVTDGDTTRLFDGADLIGEAVEDNFDFVVPTPPDLGTAAAASAGFSGFRSHPFPTCFVCGPEREAGDGLRIFPGAIDGSSVVAATWTPDSTLADAAGTVQRRHVWAALDCPSYFGLTSRPMARLGRLTARIDRVPGVGEPLVAIGWPLGIEGRKHFAGSALCDADGNHLAAALATWIEIDRLPG